ncbi:MAG TPA: cytochrome c-type biogenesis protein [Candidatus Acidoferrum sp.]|nr:cytochrome c-type biogenesis protein [Candidatus Acidoferrum sp.]
MLRRLCPLLCLLVAVLAWIPPGWADSSVTIEDVQFDNASQLEHYRALIAVLRCPKCLNTNLAGSDAPVAADMRAEIHKQILAGKSDQEILDYWVARYGDFVLYKPPLQLNTALLWFTPPALLLLGLYVLRRMMANSRELAATEQLSADEQQQLQQLLRADKQESRHG